MFHSRRFLSRKTNEIFSAAVVSLISICYSAFEYLLFLDFYIANLFYLIE